MPVRRWPKMVTRLLVHKMVTRMVTKMVTGLLVHRLFSSPHPTSTAAS